MARLLARRPLLFLLTIALPLLGGCGGAKIETAPRPDLRTPIELTTEEAEGLRAGMRTYLVSIQSVIEALVDDQMATAATAAERAGMALVFDIPVSLVTKLPPGFVALSIDTHQKFDALSRAAQSGGTKSAVLASLQDILVNCTACHATYRIVHKPQ